MMEGACMLGVCWFSDTILAEAHLSFELAGPEEMIAARVPCEQPTAIIFFDHLIVEYNESHICSREHLVTHVSVGDLPNQLPRPLGGSRTNSANASSSERSRSV